MPYNIAMISDFFYPQPGGVESHIYQLSSKLIDRGHRVIIITHAYDSPSRAGVRYLTNRVKVYHLPHWVVYRSTTFPTVFSSFPLLRQIFIREQIQIVHGHASLSNLCHEGILHARTMGLRTVFTDHSLFGFSDAASIMANKLLKFSLSDVDHVVCVSHTCKENTTLRASLNPLSVSVIPNAVVASNFRPLQPHEVKTPQLYGDKGLLLPSPPDPSQPLGPGDPITIIVISRLFYNKGTDLLISALPLLLRMHPNLRFIIAGSGPKAIDLEQTLDSLPQQLVYLPSGQSRVVLMGSIRHEEVRDVMVRGHLLLSTSGDYSTVANLAKQAYDQAHEALSSEQKRNPGESSCSLKNLRVRREWGSLSKKERKAYTKAVQCLQEKPALTPSSVAPGAKTRFDDFVATHINQTLTIHYTANFLSWHRYYTWLYEEALREECGYKGDQPYWDWAKTAHTGLAASPIFDGSETSMSGNGASVYTDDTGEIALGGSPDLPPLYLPTGNGGGCVESGPFKDMTVNLGPVALSAPGGVTVTPPTGNPLDHNPRCLKRDLVDAVNQRFANASSVLSLILKPQNIYDFQMQMQGIPGSGDIGVHGGGHYTLGGDPGNDVYVSPGDPAFYLHHGNIDRVWWIWQSLSPKDRQNAIAGTRTFLNNPPSANGTLDDLIEFDYAAGPARPIKDLMSTIRGPFCYVYL